MFRAVSGRDMDNSCYSLPVFLHIAPVNPFGNLAYNLHLCNVAAVGADMTDTNHDFLSLQLHPAPVLYLGLPCSPACQDTRPSTFHALISKPMYVEQG